MGEDRVGLGVIMGELLPRWAAHLQEQYPFRFVFQITHVQFAGYIGTNLAAWEGQQDRKSRCNGWSFDRTKAGGFMKTLRFCLFLHPCSEFRALFKIRDTIFTLFEAAYLTKMAKHEIP